MDRAESPAINPHLYNWFFTRAPRPFNKEKTAVLPTMVLGKLNAHIRKSLTPYTKFSSKCTKDLNIRAKTGKTS